MSTLFGYVKDTVNSLLGNISNSPTVPDDTISTQKKRGREDDIPRNVKRSNYPKTTSAALIYNLENILIFLEPKEVRSTWTRVSKEISQKLKNEEFWLPFITAKFGSVKGLLYYKFKLGLLLYGYKTNEEKKTLRSLYIQFGKTSTEILNIVSDRCKIYGVNFSVTTLDVVSVNSNWPVNEFELPLPSYEEPFNIAQCMFKNSIEPTKEFRDLAKLDNMFVGNGKDGFDINSDVLSVILSYLNLDDLGVVSRVNKNWYNTINDHEYLFKRLLAHFGSVRNTILFPLMGIVEIASYNCRENHLRFFTVDRDLATVEKSILADMGEDIEGFEEEGEVKGTLKFAINESNPIKLSEMPQYNGEDDLTVEIYKFRDNLQVYQMAMDDYVKIKGKSENDDENDDATNDNDDDNDQQEGDDQDDENEDQDDVEIDMVQEFRTGHIKQLPIEILQQFLTHVGHFDTSGPKDMLIAKIKEYLMKKNKI